MKTELIKDKYEEKNIYTIAPLDSKGHKEYKQKKRANDKYEKEQTHRKKYNFKEVELVQIIDIDTYLIISSPEKSRIGKTRCAYTGKIKNTNQKINNDKKIKKPTYKDLANYLEVTESAIKQYKTKKRNLMILGLWKLKEKN